MAFHYIAVEGVIGVGKTLVTQRLAERLDAATVLEDWASNPFLKAFYDGQAGAAFQTELFFLLSRYRQQQELLQRRLFSQATLCDYVFEKSKLFAYLNLDDSELLIYEKLYALLADTVPRPDLVIYLQAPVSTLIERVHRRGVDFERAIPSDYLARLAEAYTRFFYRYDEAPLLIVNSERLNFVDNPRHVDLLLQRIAGMRGAREFFNVGPD